MGPVGKPTDLAALYREERASIEANPDLIQKDRAFVLSIVRCAIAKSAVLQDSKGQVGVAGRVACPCCGTGAVSYSIAVSNGHVRAFCSTNACVSFME